MARERLITTQAQSPEEEHLNYALRPERFDQYVGQDQLLRKLKIAVTAARSRNEPMDHTLLHGPPGLGKTTLAHVIANEMGAKVHVTSGPALSKSVDLVGLLTKLDTGDVLFIDEIHRLPAIVEEYLYPAMEDYKIDIPIDSGMHARTATVNLKPFTLIGATTRHGMLTGPMRGRFGIAERLEFYSPDALLHILRANSIKLKLKAEESALNELAQRSRGTPRVANRLLRRTRDFATVEGDGTITPPIARAALELAGIDQSGLDEQDRAFLKMIIEVYEGGPVGIEALAASLGEDRATLEDVIEPYLLQTKLITRTSRGRFVTKLAFEHLGLRFIPPRESPNLFEPE